MGRQPTQTPETAEAGKVLTLPGMGTHDFDYCTCGVGWPMGNHHKWSCPAHCICGRKTARERSTCTYHSGETGKMPVAPSVTTELWDLSEGKDRGKDNAI